jgi:hypothetical protein
MQGMNEVLAPLYYCFATDPDEAWCRHAEADAFFCFTRLMSEIRDVFIKSLDDSATGIGARPSVGCVARRQPGGEPERRWWQGR